MKFVYLIDYENVRDDGLDGIFDLEAEDIVYVFYTENADRIGIPIVSKLLDGDCKAKIIFKNVSPGKQSLDLQLSSHLGYLIGTDGTDGIMYIIISKDTGFESMLNFWNEDGEKFVRLFQKIKTCINYHKNDPTEDEATLLSIENEEVAPTPVAEKQKKKPVEKKKTTEDAQKTDTAQKGNKKSELNDSVQKTLSKVKIGGKELKGKEINEVASIVKKHRNDASNKIKTNIRNALVKQYGQEKGNEIYKAIRKHIEDYKKEQ